MEQDALSYLFTGFKQGHSALVCVCKLIQNQILQLQASGQFRALHMAHSSGILLSKMAAQRLAKKRLAHAT